MKQVLPLLVIVLFVWSALMALSYLMSRVIFVVTLPGTGSFASTMTGIVRVIAGVLVALVWLYGWKKLTDRYFWRAIRNRTNRT